MFESFEIKSARIADIAANMTSEHFQCQKAVSAIVVQQTACQFAFSVASQLGSVDPTWDFIKVIYKRRPHGRGRCMSKVKSVIWGVLLKLKMDVYFRHYTRY